MAEDRTLRINSHLEAIAALCNIPEYAVVEINNEFARLRDIEEAARLVAVHNPTPASPDPDATECIYCWKRRENGWLDHDESCEWLALRAALGLK